MVCQRGDGVTDAEKNDSNAKLTQRRLAWETLGKYSPYAVTLHQTNLGITLCHKQYHIACLVTTRTGAGQNATIVNRGKGIDALRSSISILGSRQLLKSQEGSQYTLITFTLFDSVLQYRRFPIKCSSCFNTSIYSRVCFLSSLDLLPSHLAGGWKQSPYRSNLIAQRNRY
jgi:hypothetical protein